MINPHSVFFNRWYLIRFGTNSPMRMSGAAIRENLKWHDLVIVCMLDTIKNPDIVKTSGTLPHIH